MSYKLHGISYISIIVWLTLTMNYDNHCVSMTRNAVFKTKSVSVSVSMIECDDEDVDRCKNKK